MTTADAKDLPCTICGEPKYRHDGPQRSCRMFATYRAPKPALEASPNSRTEAITDEMLTAGRKVAVKYCVRVEDFQLRAIYTAMQAARPIDQQEAKHDGQPIGVHAYECRKCGKGIEEMRADPVCAPVQDDERR